MKILRKYLTALLLLALVVSLGYAAQWQGFWGGQSIYPGTERFEPGRWEEPPVCWAFSDSPTHPWTEAEKAVVRVALQEWNEADSQLRRRIFEASEPACRDRPLDILLRWEGDRSFFRDWGDPNRDGFALNASRAVGFYVPERVAPPLQIEPCPDLQAAGVLERCSVVFLNVDNPNGWFVDPSPGQDEEFEPTSVTLCGVSQTVLKAKRGGPAEGKQDLYTVVLHEFGHALGLVHSGGCDKNPLTGPPPDDDGAVMWEGFLTQRRDLEDIVRGLGERVHLDPITVALLQVLYPPTSPARLTSFPSGGRGPKRITKGSLLVANNGSNTVAMLDPRTGRLEALFPVGTFPIDIAVDRQNQRAYVANFGSDDVSVIDLEAKRVVGRIGVGRQPAAIAFDPNANRLYTANFGDNTVTVMTLRSVPGGRFEVLERFNLRVRQPLDVAFSPDGTRLYVVSAATDRAGAVVVLEVAQRREAGRLLVVEGSVSLPLWQEALSPDGKRLYVTARKPDGSGRLAVIDLEKLEVIQLIPAGLRAYGVAASPDGCFVVVTNLGSNDVTVIGAREGTVVATLRDPGAREPFGVVVLGSRAYVTNFQSNNISVFELGMCP